MDAKRQALCEELLVIIVLSFCERAQGLRFERLYPMFNYGFGTISDLLKDMVADDQVCVCFECDCPPIGYPDNFPPSDEQIKKLHICDDSRTYIYPTEKGRLIVLQIVSDIQDNKREFRFSGMLNR